MAQKKTTAGWTVVALATFGLAVATYACSTNSATASRSKAPVAAVALQLGRTAGQSQFLSVTESRFAAAHSAAHSAPRRPLFLAGPPGSQLVYAATYERGLSVIDVSADTPQRRGRVAASGNWPVTMYLDALHERIVVLENVYYDASTDVHNWSDVQSRLVAYDVSRPEDPRIAAIVELKGMLSSSRQVGDVLYVATNVRPTAGDRHEGSKAYVHSFKLGDWVRRVEQLELGSPVLRDLEAIDATGDGSARAYFIAVLARDGSEWSPRPHRIEVIDVSDAEGHIQTLMQVALQDPVDLAAQLAIDREAFRVGGETFFLPRHGGELLSAEELATLPQQALRGKFTRASVAQGDKARIMLLKPVADEVNKQVGKANGVIPAVGRKHELDASQDAALDAFLGLELVRDVRAYMTLSNSRGAHGVQIVQQAAATELRLVDAMRADAEASASLMRLELPGRYSAALQHGDDRLVVLTVAASEGGAAEHAANLIGLDTSGELKVISRAVWRSTTADSGKLLQLAQGRMIAVTGTALHDLRIGRAGIFAEPLALRGCNVPLGTVAELASTGERAYLRYAEPVADSLVGSPRYQRSFISILTETVGALACSAPLNIPGRPILLRDASLVTEEPNANGSGRVLSSLVIQGNKAVLVDRYEAQHVKAGAAHVAFGAQIVFLQTEPSAETEATTAALGDAWPPGYESTVKRWTSLTLDRALHFAQTTHELNEALGAHPQITGLLHRKSGGALAVVTQGQAVQVFSFLGTARPSLARLEKIGAGGERLPLTGRLKLDGPAWWTWRDASIHFSDSSSTLELILSKFGVTQARVVE